MESRTSATLATQERDFPGGDVGRALVDRMYRAGVSAHPTVALDEESFRRAVRSRAEGADSSDDDRPSDRLHRIARIAGGPDLFLAVACERSSPGAWETLATAFVPRLARALTAQGVPVGEADAIAADVPGDMVQPPQDGRSTTRIGLYRGLSSLFSFLTVSALRQWTNRRRARAVDSLDTSTPEPTRGGPSPLDRLASVEAATRSDVAITRAWSEFTPKEALALLYKHRDGLPQKAIAALLDVGEPRVSRLLTRGAERLRAALEAALAVGSSGPSPGEQEAVRFAIGCRLATLAPPPPPTRASTPSG